MKYNVSADFLPDNTNTDITVQNNTVTLSNGSEITLVKAEGHPNLYRAITNGTTIPVILHTNSKGDVEITMRGYKYQLQVHDERNVKFLTMLKSSAGNQNSAQKVVAPMPGLLKQLFVSAGQHVKKGENLFVLEAMKMENIIKSPIAGTIQSVQAEAGTAVEKGNLLCVITA